MFENFVLALAILAVWELIWKGIALWHAAKKDSKAWFIAILLLNTMGILPIVYLVLKTDFFKSNKKAKKSRTKRTK